MATHPKAGDKVKLNVGGPKMSVKKLKYVTGEKKVEVVCQWFDKAELREGEFAPEQLEPVK